MVEEAQGARASRTGRWLLAFAAVVLAASTVFSVVEVRNARHRSDPADAPTGAPAAAPGISGLSLSGLRNLENQVKQAAAIVRGTSGTGGSSDLSQLEQQFGISPSASTQNQLQALQDEIDKINACLSGSPSATPDGC